MSQGLAISDIVNVQVNLSPAAATYRNFGAALTIGSSNIIDVSQRIRSYSDLDGVATDFGTTAPEYLAADFHFSQVPTPAILYIGRWAQTATNGLLHGAILTPTQQVLANFTAITAGSFHVSIDGTGHDITGLNFSAALNLNGVASDIQTALSAIVAGTTCQWDSANGRFTISSPTTGIASSVSYGSTAATGTDISTQLGLTAASGASAPVIGVAAETLLSCASTLANISKDWYFMDVATVSPPSDSDLMATAQFIEGNSVSRFFGATITNTNVLDPTQSGDLGSELQALNLSRTASQYSSSSAYAMASLIARQSTVDFTANNSVITLKFKQEPGVVAEYLTETGAQTLKKKNVNVFVNYQNGKAIIQEGVMANGTFIDTRVGVDWLQNAIQTDVFNLLYQSTSKIPQTDAGVHLIVTTIENTLAAAVNNGLLAPGIWNAQGFGSLNEGDMLSKGFYVFAPLIATQSQTIRETRTAPTIQVAAKGAGAIHFANIIINFNS
jgi:hypothetical protein